MESQIIKTQYYIEFGCGDISHSASYALQSKTFDTAEEAENWYKTNFDYTDDCMSVYVMAMEYYSEDGYDISQVKQLF